MNFPDREPVSRRGGPARPALSRAAIVTAALAVADRDGLDAVTMRQVAAELDTGASALYVYLRNRDQLLAAMFDAAMADVAAAVPPDGPPREQLSWLLLAAVRAATGRGGLARIALTTVPAGPNATVITARVRDLLTAAGVAAAAIPGALDLLGLFVTAAALDRVPAAAADPGAHQRRLRWEIDVLLNGLAATPPE